MNTSKRIKHTAIFLICLAFIALAGFNIYQRHQIRQNLQKMPPAATTGSETLASPLLNDDLVSLENPVKNHSNLNANDPVVDDPVNELIYQIKAAEEELTTLKDQLAEDEAKKAQAKELRKELQKQYMKNPYYASMIKRSLADEYSDLSKKLNLSSEENDEFNDILFKKQTAMMEMSMAYSDMDELTPEEQEERSNRYQAIQEETDSKLKELLGENNYETYNFYIETQYLRHQVSDYSGYLDSDNALSDSQKESLIEAMNDEVQYIVYDTIETDGETSANLYDENRIEIRTTNQEKRYDAYLNAAAGILSASQIEAFEEYIENEREQYKTMTEMSALHYKISETQKSIDENDD